MKSKGLLLINLGTPDNPEPKAVGVYLREFLMDPNVISIPFIFRWILVNLGIIPLRRVNSSNNYKKIWREDGSPLLVYTEKLTELAKKNSNDYAQIEFAMRYGKPSIKRVLKKFKGVDEVDVLALYPHDTKSSVGTAFEETRRCLKKGKHEFSLNELPVFFKEKFYNDEMIGLIKDQINDEDLTKSHFVFSYHGIPVSHLKGVCEGMGSEKNCCSILSDKNKNCYRAQCFESTRILSKQLNLDDSQVTTVFQSRVGKAEWIPPNIDLSMVELAHANKKNIVIISPSFVSDCLETLEELGMGVKSDYEKLLPGAQVKVLTCLNERESFASSLTKWCFSS